MSNNMSQDMYMRSWTEAGMNDGYSSLAIARVVFQPDVTRVYNTSDALKRGTLFPELDKPFMGKRGAY